MKPDVVTLLLPGMTLNPTIFPTLSGQSMGVDFTRMVISADGSLPPHSDGPLGAHLDALRRQLTTSEAWRAAECRLAVGHSFGGMLLLKWLLDDRPDLDGAILVSTTAEEATMRVDEGSPQPAPGVINVEPGLHEIVVAAPGYHPFTRRVDVPEGTTYQVQAELEGMPGAVVIAGPKRAWARLEDTS